MSFLSAGERVGMAGGKPRVVLLVPQWGKSCSFSRLEEGQGASLPNFPVFPCAAFAPSPCTGSYPAGMNAGTGMAEAWELRGEGRNFPGATSSLGLSKPPALCGWGLCCSMLPNRSILGAAPKNLLFVPLNPIPASSLSHPFYLGDPGASPSPSVPPKELSRRC